MGQLKPVPATRKVDVVYGSNWIEDVEVFHGQTIKEVLANTKLKEKAGYGNLAEGNIRYAIDGKEVSPDTVVINPDKEQDEKMQLEILRNVGEKAGV